jgi:hypothetical protein
MTRGPVMDSIDFQEQIAECVGLWLAEGSTTSKREITFTNNCIDLIDLFHQIMNLLFKDYSFNQRVYIYSKNGEKILLPYSNCIFKYYIHKRATKPYYIFRIASVKIIEKWNQIVLEKLDKKIFYPSILRGFFAGEGNVKEGKRSVRVLRISQAIPKEFINNMLNELNITYNFTSSNRMYNISNKTNWDIFAKYKLADLHPAKKERFWRLYNSYKQVHYDNNYLIKEVYNILDQPKTSRQLSTLFKRSFSRIQDVLILLKKKGKIKNFRVRSIDYWTNDNNLVILSYIKNRYLLFLDKPRLTSEFAKEFKVDWQSSSKRLYELQKLNLVIKDSHGLWKKLKTSKRIIVI